MHPVNAVALWLWWVCCLPWLGRFSLFISASFLLVLACCVCRGRFLRSIARLKWVFAALLLIYGLTTPGIHLWAGWASPTQEGLLAGGEQMARLLCVVASLQVLLGRIDRDGLFSSLYLLLWPLRALQGARERLAVRLALTIEVAEGLLEQKLDFSGLLSRLEQVPECGVNTLRVMYKPLTCRQLILLLGQLGALFLFLMSAMKGVFWS